ncbi:MAG: hypothetical protein IPI41_16420 [Flavobacteriales bacterium]|nr:hypothetical protein [Flavobacteriales bacterium]
MKGDTSMSVEDESAVIRGLYPQFGFEYHRITSLLSRKGAHHHGASLFNRNTCLLFAARILAEGNFQSGSAADISGSDFVRYYLAFEEEIAETDFNALNEIRGLSPSVGFPKIGPIVTGGWLRGFCAQRSARGYFPPHS